MQLPLKQPERWLIQTFLRKSACIYVDYGDTATGAAAIWRVVRTFGAWQGHRRRGGIIAGLWVGIIVVPNATANCRKGFNGRVIRLVLLLAWVQQ
ncbi:hypothetical protein [Tahibacter amnicola]|uniref:Uncharacterized protein n=1 Tax=Tahibacter amnicola TaxID=2976241 RepID=A0ABY6BDK4_9GAMM|nr:hypothetical protein [Tahibacter amnicola]UXI67934.1 hypothetical protein N4264_24930 [Tahibacter amnicola]